MKATSTASSVATQAPATPAPEKSRTTMLIAVGVSLAVAATGFTLMRPPAGSVTAADTALPAPSVAPAGPAGGGPQTPGTGTAHAAPGAPAPAETIDVSISVDPPEARVSLDDMQLASNPFHGAMARSPLARRLRISAPGYTAEERLVTLDRDLHLELVLKPVAGAAPGPVAGARSGAHAEPQTPAATTASAHAAPPGSPTAAPGESLTNPARKKPRSIDTDF